MKKTILKSSFLLLLSTIFFGYNGYPKNLEGRPTATDWSTLLANRGHLAPSHQQGYTTDFCSHGNFKTAVNKMSDHNQNFVTL